MNIRIHSNEINRMMKTVSQCIDSKMGKFGNIEIAHEDNKLTIRGTNGTFYAETSCAVMGGDGEKFCVDGTMFGKVCALCNGEISIETDGRVCTVKGAGRTRIPIVECEIPERERISGKVVRIAADAFSKGYGGVAYAVATEQSRIVLTGVNIETGYDGMTMVGLDGFQMATEKVPCSGDDVKAIVPGAFMKLLNGGIASGEMVTITFGDNQIQAETDGMMVCCGRLSGEYPDWKKILPGEFATESRVHVSQVRDALKSGAVINSESKLVKIRVDADEITVMSNSEAADYEAKVSCETQGDGLMIAFNQKYLMNTFASIDTEDAVMKFNSAVAPAVVVGMSGTGSRLVLPVRVQG